MKTVMVNPQTAVHEWLVIDAANVPLGRVASQVAAILRGKHKPSYTPHTDNGDYVIVINTDKIVLTGKKLVQKTAFRHSGFPGGTTFTQYKDLMKNKSDFVLKKAVKGMLPKNALGRAMFSKLKAYKGDQHPHEAQQPKPYKIVGGR